MTLSKTYLLLMALLAASWAAAHMQSGGLTTSLGLGIAAVKTTLVVFFFMQVAREHPVTRLFASIGVLWLAVLISFCLGDYYSRSWLVFPGSWPH